MQPRGLGELPPPALLVQVSNPVCGDELSLWLELQGGLVAAARFRARGCSGAIACASALVEILPGRSVAEAKKLGRDELLALLDGLPTLAMHGLDLALDALDAALREA